MPATKKESIIFGMIMCFGMVLVMSLYNLYLNGILGQMTFMETTLELVVGYVIALLLDIFVVGPNAKKIALKLTEQTEKPLHKILAISIFMVLGMAFFMSIYGLITTYIHVSPVSDSMILDFLVIFGKKHIVAAPLQIIIMGPVVRYIFKAFVQQ
ncbi:DUF2798 domain-containing protein [Marinilactibacillus piezotolerans]|uniref:DUF2798 domain-containing protein n=1 Tax=Marinilactibacillus piezotolerans TaxID=258723 RepID=UPI0009B07EE3|nr:DUF2798 domain-containing protein [Marinilactibacillus piezotolerans]